MRPYAALLALLACAGGARAARASTSCEAMVAIGASHERSADDDKAVRAYTEAVSLDPQCGAAWLRLGELRLRRGDALEAKRVLVAARERIADLAEAAAPLARARWALGERADAELDLAAYASSAAPPEQARALRQLAAWYGEERNAPAQLGVWRRLLAIAERAGDAAALKEARTTVRALVLLSSTLDPVTAPGGAPASKTGTDPVRRALAAAGQKL